MPRRLALETCVVDLEQGLVLRDKHTDTLTPIEVSFLRWLAERPGIDVPRDELLEQVWGYHNAVVSRAVDSTVKRLRRKIERDAAQPTHLQTAAGVGYRLVLTARPAAVAPGPLSEPLFGRKADLERLEAALAEGALATITGPAGVGKSRLAAELARRRAGETVRCDLHLATADPVRAVGHALDVPLGDVRDTEDGAARIADALAGRGPLLLVLDGADAAIETVRTRVLSWLTARDLRILVTSRQRLGLRGERVIALQPLQLGEARALLLDRARAAGAELASESTLASDIPSIDALCERLDGLPLALELAATRLDLMTPAELLHRLEAGMATLGPAQLGAPAHHASLDAAIALSWEALPVQLRAALAACTVFRGGFDLDAAEVVLGPNAVDILAALVDRSLVIRRGARLDLLNAVRSFAAARLTEPVEVEQRHASAYAARTPPLTDSLASGWLPLDVLAADFDNFQIAAERAARSSPELAARCALALEELVARRGPRPLREPVVALAMSCAREPQTRFRAALAASRLRFREGRGGPGTIDTLAALAIAREQHDTRLERLALCEHGRRLVERGEIAEAQRALHAAAALSPDDDGWQGLIAYELGRIAAKAGAADEARAAFQSALTACERASDRGGIALACYGRAWVALDAGDLFSADRDFRRAVATWREVGDERADVLRGLLALVAAARRDWPEAEAILAESMAFAARRGMRSAMAEDRFVLGIVRIASGQPNEAALVLEEALEDFILLGRPNDAAVAGATRAIALSRSTRASEATQALAHARELALPGGEDSVIIDIATRLLAGEPSDDLTERCARSVRARLVLAVSLTR